jgi:hypothetical protein
MYASTIARVFGVALLCVAFVMQGRIAVAQQRAVTATQVDDSIKRCVAYLYSEQAENGPVKGGWNGHNGYGCGNTALVTLALLSAGEKPSDVRIKKALDLIRRTVPTQTYDISLHCMVLCMAEPNRDLASIRKDVDMLVQSQSESGGWGYSKDDRTPDESNAQFAVLALWEAGKLGIPVPEECLKKAYRYWVGTHNGAGWGYREMNRNSTGSMTCAGIASMLILMDSFDNLDAQIKNGQLQCCGSIDSNREDRVSRGLNWLAANFSVQGNPGSASWGFYYLYALERVGRLTGQRYIGAHDWYREGATHIVASQTLDAIRGGTQEDPILATAMSLLFLSKGKRQVVIGHLQHGSGEDWQIHRRAVQNLTGQIEKVWKRELSWQSVRLKDATLEALLETPILFISGSQEFRLTPEQRKMLKEYVENGNLIFAEACNGDGCNGDTFDKSFRAEMEQIFEKPFSKLSPAHVVWAAEAKIDPNAMPEGFWLYGIDACCKTSVIYSPISLSCRWELARPWGNPFKSNEALKADIDNAVKIGVNVAAYATGRELKNKLDAVEILQAPKNYQSLERGALKLPKIQHAGGADEASRAVVNLLDFYSQKTRALIDRDVPLLSMNSEEIEKFPLLYIHGRTKFVFSESERAGLRKHFENGGFVIGDSICASKDFSNSLRDEFLKAIPDAKWRTLDANHSFMTPDGNGFDKFDVRNVVLVDPNLASGDLVRSKRPGPPEIEALEWNGRIVMLFSPNDLSCAMESKHSLQCRGYVRKDAFAVAVNMILFSLSQ